MPATFTTDWFAPHIPVWSSILASYKGQPASFLEVGCWEGQASCWLLEHILTHPDARLTCIDLFHLSPAKKEPYRTHTKILEKIFDENIRSTGMQHKVIKKVGYSVDVLQTLPMRAYDCVYIDGSYVASDVLNDAMLSWLLLKDGGVMIFNNYAWRPALEEHLHPKAAIDVFLSHVSGEYEILHKAFQVIIRKTPPRTATQ